MMKQVYLWLILGSILGLPLCEYLFLTIESHEIVSQIQENFDEVAKKTDDILIAHKREIEAGKISFERLLSIGSKYPVFIFKNDELIYWSDNSLPVDYRELKKFYKEKILKIQDGSLYYLKKLSAYGGLEYVVVVPVLRRFRSESSVLAPKFEEDIFGDLTMGIVDVESDAYNQNKIYNKSRNLALFSLEINKEFSLSYWFYVFQLLIFLLLIWSIFEVVRSHLRMMIKSKKTHLAFIYLFTILVSVRFLMLYFKLPYFFYRYEFMSSKVYAASWVKPSLGDVFFNGFAIFLLVLFFFNHNTQLIPYKGIFKSKFKPLISGLYFLLPTVVCYITKLQIESLFLDSQINLDISDEVSFSFPKIIGFVFFTLCMVFFFLIGNITIRFIEKSVHSLKNQVQICAISHLLFILLTGEWVIGILSGGYLLFCLFMGYAFSLRDYERGAFSYIISTILIFSLIGTSFVGEFSIKKKFEVKKKLASKLAVENDFKAEWHLYNLRKIIQSDTTFYDKVILNDNLNNDIFSRLPRYFSAYEINSYFENSSESYKIKSIEDKVVSTSFEGVYLFNDLKPLDRKYLTVIDIFKNKILQGQLILEIRQKTPLTNSVVEKITNYGHYNAHFFGDFAFSHVRWGNLITSSGSFLYDKAFMIEYEKNIDLQNYRFYVSGFEHFAEPDGEGGHFIVSSPIFSMGDYFSNFAFIFLFLVFNMLISLSVLGYIYRKSEIKLSFASKIQFYLNSAFFIPFLVVSIVIVSILNYTSQQETTLFFLDKAENMTQRIIEKIEEKPFLEVSIDSLSDLLKAYSIILQADFNFFDKNGMLAASSQDYIFRNGLLSDRIHPYSFMQLKEKRVAHWQSKEQIASINFNSIYLSVKSIKSGQIVGYLGLPFYGSKRSFDKLVVEILTTIAKIFSSIFILLFLVLRFSTRALTNPLRLLREKLKNTSLSRKNQPIDYLNKDEIGLLVAAYNSMIDQLEDSKQALARSEKESAWREMAKQVAHEIKNPLTPMKLTLQHMLRTVKEPATLKAIKTLLGQIESLADIASSFASYAKMPLPVEDELDIAEVLQQTIALHRADCEIWADIPNEELIVMGDKNMLGRIFSNLILNGIQAAHQNRTPKIEIKITKTDELKVLIEVKDNGTGIPDDIQSKVFIPDFTTKTTGSGIGLALSKRGIEHLGGSIWFESLYGEGTTFFIEMPLVRQSKKEKPLKQISI